MNKRAINLSTAFRRSTDGDQVIMNKIGIIIIAAFAVYTLSLENPLDICKQTFSHGECVYLIR